MPGALRAVAPAYAALAPGGGQGPWLPEPCAKRAWPDALQDFAGYGSLGLDAFESPSEPCQKRPRLAEETSGQPLHDREAVVGSRWKRPTAGVEEPAKRQRSAAPAADDEREAVQSSRAGCPGGGVEEECGRRVARRTQSSSAACTDVVPQGSARILSCIRDAFVPCSPDVRDALDHGGRLPVHLDREALHRLRAVGGRARRPLALQAHGAGDGLPGLLVFRNGHCHAEPMEALLPQAEEPELPGLVIYSGRRRAADAVAGTLVPSPQYGLRAPVQQDEEETDEEDDEEAHPMVL